MSKNDEWKRRGQVAAGVTSLYRVLLCLLFIYMPAQGQSLVDLSYPYFRHLDDKGAITWGIVNSLAQDKGGFVWIGTQNSLLRYDGYRFKPYYPKGGIDGNNGLKTFIFASADGRVFSGSSGGLAIYEPSRDQLQYLSASEQDESAMVLGSIQEMLEVPGEGFWLASLQGLEFVDLQLNLKKRYRAGVSAQGLSSSKVRSIQIDEGKGIWIAGDKGLDFLDFNSGEVVRNALGLSEEINHILLAQDGKLWLALKEQGILIVSAAESDAALDRKVVKKHLINTRSKIIQVTARQVWVGEKYKGIYIVDADSGEVIDNPRSDPIIDYSLSTDRVSTMMVDDSGMVWVGHYGGGIDHYSTQSKAFHMIPLRSSRTQQMNPVSAIRLKIDSENKPWVASDSLLKLKPDKVNPFELHTGLISKIREISPEIQSDFDITAMAIGPHDRMWFSTTKHSLLSYEPELRVVKSAGLTGDEACAQSYHVYFSSDRFLWLACNEGNYLLRWDTLTKKPLKITIDKSMLFNYFSVLNYSSNEDRLWIGSEAGLHYIDNPNGPAVEIELKSSSLAGIDVTGVLTTDSGIWVDSSVGLYRGDVGGDKLEYINPVLGLDKKQVFGNMLTDSKGRIWSDEGVLDPQSLSLIPFQIADGFSIDPNWIGSYGAIDENNLLFGGENSLLLIQPDYFKPWTYAPKVVVTHFLKNGVGQSWPGGAVHLGVEDKSFAIDVAALDYSSPSHIQYRYRLVGLDHDWINTGSANRRIQYSNLDPGNYQLEVVGSNRLGEWSPHRLSLGVEVEAAWYQTLWFKILLLGLAAWVIYGIVRLRTRQLELRQVELEGQISQRTEELSQSLDEVRRTQAQLVENEKQLSLGRMVRGIAHELNTPIGILNMTVSMLPGRINHLLSLLDSGKGEPSELEKSYKSILTTTDLLEKNIVRSAALVAQFKTIAVDEQVESKSFFSVFEKLKLTVERNFDISQYIVIKGDANLEIHSYPSAFTQIVNELIINSFNHGYQKDIDSLAKSDGISIEYGIQNGRLVLRYRDHGAGMDEEGLQKMFDPFYTTSNKVELVGLGMHLVHNLVTQQFQGEIECRSKPGDGVEIQIKLIADAEG